MATGSASEFTIVVIADPGLPTSRFESVREVFTAELHEAFDRPVSTHVRSEVIETWSDNTLRLGPASRVRTDYDEVDLVLMLTEMPRFATGKPLVAELFPDKGVAAFYWPTLGLLARRSKIVDVLVDCTARLAVKCGLLEHSTPRRHPYRWATDPRTGTPGLQAHVIVGGWRTVVGMVITNAPWRAASKLSSALAAASAAGAFGIFYNSIWQMAAALSTGRLLFIGLLAVTAMAAWLILGNRLWERPGPEGKNASMLLYNLSTVLTLLLCVLALYALLVVLILLAGLIVIDPDFMSEILGKQSHFGNYLDIAWLSAALGVIAGALGSNFDSETDVRRLTHGRRERLRHNDDE